MILIIIIIIRTIITKGNELYSITTLNGLSPSSLEGLLLVSVLIKIMEHTVNGCGDFLKGKCQQFYPV